MPLSTTALPAQAKRVLLCTNPKAGAGGRGELAQGLAHRLKEAGYQAEVICDLDRVAEANRLQAAGELRALVSLGGDGTAAELVNRTVPGVPLAVFPVGTENLLARYLGMEANAESLCQAIASGEALRADAGRANGRIFLLMLGCGFDAEVVHQLSATRTGHIRRWTYAKPILAAARSYRYPSVRLVTETLPGGGLASASHEACWAFLFNLPCYAGGLGLATHADGGDGALDLCTFARGSFWHGLWYLGGVLTGMHRRMPDFTTRRVQRVRLEADERVPYQLDGDPGGCLPVEVETLPGRLTLFASPARLAALRCPPARGRPA